MTDFKLTEDLQISFDHTGDIATVSGKEEFEQTIALALTEDFVELVGEFDDETAKELARVKAGRVAGAFPEIESVASIDVSFSETDVKTLEVTITYDTGGTTTLEVSG